MPEEYVDPASSARGSKLASNFTVSLTFDRRLYKHEIKTSIAHAKMLGAENIIPLEDSKKIISGLKIIESEIKSGEFVWKEDLEDIHMNVESRLYELIGDSAGKLHTGRSRNDQIATDVRLWVKDACVDLVKECKNLQLSLIELAQNNIKTVIPGYTHLQRGQPILLAHHFLAYFEMINRDIQRLQQVYKASDIMPLGSGAISGDSYPINRKMVATELKFSKISSNSVDAVSDRDFIVEFLSSTSICMTHLSKLSEELIIWSTEEFGFVTLSEQFTSGSSIMPQKRNPDFSELIRGKTGRVYGALFGILTILKGLPLAYNRDLQEDKEGLFDAYDTTLSCIRTANGIISTMEINTNAIEKAMKSGFILATDIADYLTNKGLPFRQAHIIMSSLSEHCRNQGKNLSSLTVEEFRSISPYFDESVKDISVDSSIKSRDIKGGTAPNRVIDELKAAKIAIPETWP